MIFVKLYPFGYLTPSMCTPSLQKELTPSPVETTQILPQLLCQAQSPGSLGEAQFSLAGQGVVPHSLMAYKQANKQTNNIILPPTYVKHSGRKEQDSCN